MLYILAYDVSTETRSGRKRLRKMAKICENYGQRVQKSVFEFQIEEKQFLRLRKEVLKLINEDKDAVRIYKIVEPQEKYIEEYGNFQAVNYEEDTLII